MLISNLASRNPDTGLASYANVAMIQCVNSIGLRTYDHVSKKCHIKQRAEGASATCVIPLSKGILSKDRNTP